MSLLDEKALGKRLQEVRRQKGYTQQTLCQKASLSYSTLAKIERGAIKSPSVFTVISIAQAMDISLDSLLGISGGVGVDTGRHYQRTQSGVSFIYFDLNDTLIRAAQRGFTLLAEEAGVLPDVIETLFWHYNDALNRGTMSMTDFNALLSKRLGITVDWRETYLTTAEIIQPMHELLTWTAQHYRVGILTNTLPGLVSGLRERHLLPDVPYQAIVDSSELGVGKPEQAIFAIAQDRAGVAANEILLIDDTRSNIVAAEQQGWHVALFDGYRVEESVERLRTNLTPAN